MAMVANQGSYMLSKPHTLVFRIFKARVFPQSPFLDAKLGYNPSFVWRSIWKARETLTLGCRCSIGDGSNIMVMNETWIRGPREGCLDGPKKQGAYNLTVNNLMLSNLNQWDIRALYELFDCVAVE